MFVFANVIQEAFSPLITLAEEIMVFMHAHLVGGSWGLAIVGLTVVVRAVMVPATLSQLRGARKMQLHAPELKKIKEKYADDRQRQNEETMKYMREMGINPAASCLPLVLQIPVFISLFYMLRSDLKKHICGPQLVSHYNALHHKAITAVGHLPSSYISNTSCQTVAHGSAKFLFVSDITAKATGVVLIVLIVLYLASQVTSTLIMSSGAEPNQRLMMLVLPLVFVAILFQYPAGLLVYWITTNLWTLAQGYIVRRRMGPPPSPTSPNGKVDEPRKPALATAGVTEGTPRAAPPPPPRKKKKRSGRRR